MKFGNFVKIWVWPLNLGGQEIKASSQEILKSLNFWTISSHSTLNKHLRTEGEECLILRIYTVMLHPHSITLLCPATGCSVILIPLSVTSSRQAGGLAVEVSWCCFTICKKQVYRQIWSAMLFKTKIGTSDLIYLLTLSFFFPIACSRHNSDSGVQAKYKASPPPPPQPTTSTTKDERRMGKAVKEPFCCHCSPILLIFHLLYVFYTWLSEHLALVV